MRGLVTSFLQMNNTYPSVASVALVLRLGFGQPGCTKPSPRRQDGMASFSPNNARTVLGHSMSKGLKKKKKKKRRSNLHRLLLAVLFNYFN